MTEIAKLLVSFAEELREGYPHPALKAPFFLLSMLIFAISASIFRLLGDWKGEVGALGHIGIGLKNLKLLEAALAVMRRCLEIAKENQADDEFVSIYHGEIGDIEVALNRLEDSRPHLERSLQTASPLDKCRRHYQLAECLIALGEYEEANRHLEESERLAQEGKVAHPSHGVGAVLARAVYWMELDAEDEALLRAQEALALAEQLRLFARVAQAKELIARIEGKNP